MAKHLDLHVVLAVPVPSPQHVHESGYTNTYISLLGFMRSTLYLLVMYPHKEHFAIVLTLALNHATVISLYEKAHQEKEAV